MIITTNRFEAALSRKESVKVKLDNAVAAGAMQ